MLRRFVSLLPVVLLLTAAAVLLSSCGDRDAAPTEDGVMTPVTDADGTVTGYERRYHNDDGAVTRLDVYDAEQNYLRYVLYGYDDDGRLFTETFYAANGIAQSRTVYSYDDDGWLSHKAFESPYGDTAVEMYSSDGTLIEKRFYGADEQLQYREVLEDGAWVRYDPTEPPATSDEAE